MTASKAIKKELKTLFPKVKFSVRESAHSCVYVSYKGDVAREDVKNVTDKYQSASYNPIEDIHEHTNKRDDIPQVETVLVSKDIN